VDQSTKALRARFDNKSKEREQCKHCKRGFHTEAKCWKLDPLRELYSIPNGAGTMEQEAVKRS